MAAGTRVAMTTPTAGLTLDVTMALGLSGTMAPVITGLRLLHLTMVMAPGLSVSGTMAPTSGTIAPTSGTMAPTSGTMAPTSGTMAPTSGTVAPTSGTVAPTGGQTMATIGLAASETPGLSLSGRMGSSTTRQLKLAGIAEPWNPSACAQASC